MNGAASHTGHTVAPAVFIIAAIVAIALFLISPQEAARGWLIAFSVFSQIALGSLALLLIHNLTATSWGAAFGPILRRLLWGVPLLALFFLVIAFNLPAIYPWAASPESIPHDVARYYLNPLGFWVRSAIAIGGWLWFATQLLNGPIGRLSAAVGLTFFGLSSYVLGYDWFLSIGAPFISSSFFGEIAIQSLLAALAAAALFAPDVSDEQARSDLGAFLIAGCLGVFYFELMALIINWYGNLPDQAAWYLERVGPWAAVAGDAALLGTAIPIAALLWGSVRASGSGLRLVGISVLCGIALHMLWLFAPLATRLALISAVAALAAMVAALAALVPIGERYLSGRRPRHA